MSIDKKSKIENLFLVNNKYLEFLINENYVPVLNEPITSSIKIPPFEFDSNGSKLMIFVVRNKFNEYNVIISQLSFIDEENYQINLLYPQNVNFDQEWKTIKAWITVAPDHNLKDVPTTKKYLLNNLSQTYSNKNIDSEFMRVLLENDTILPNDLNSVQIILKQLNFDDLNRIRSISTENKNIIDNFVISELKQKYNTELNNIPDYYLKNLDLMSLYKTFQESQNLKFIDWVAGSNNLELLQFMIEKLNIVPEESTATYAAYNNHVNILEYLASLTPPLFSNIDGADAAAAGGSAEVLNWLYGDRPSIKTLALKYNHPNTIKWIEENMPTPPDDKIDLTNFKFVAQNKRIFPVNIIYSYGRPSGYYLDENREAIGPHLAPTETGANLALKNGHENVLNGLLGLHIFPSLEDSVVIALSKGFVNAAEIITNVKNYTGHRDNINFNEAIIESTMNDKLNSLQWIESKYLLGKTELIDIMNIAINRGYLDIVEWLLTSRKLAYLGQYLYLALKNSKFNIVDWFISNGVTLEPDLADNMIEQKDTRNIIEVLNYLQTKNILPTVKSANFAVATRNTQLEEWLREHNIVSDDNSANFIIKSNIDYSERSENADIRKLEMLKYFEKDEGILPNTEGANLAIKYKYYNILKWLSEKGILPNERGLDYAIGSNDKNLINWLVSLNINPTVKGANAAARNGDISMLNWIAEKGILPNSEAFDEVISRSQYGTDQLVQWFMNHNILPTQKGANAASRRNSPELLNWLIQNKMYPNDGTISRLIKKNEGNKIANLYTSGVVFSKNIMQKIIDNDNPNFVKALKQRQVYDSIRRNLINAQ